MIVIVGFGNGGRPFPVRVSPPLAPSRPFGTDPNAFRCHVLAALLCEFHIPLGTADRPDSVVLRPVDSVDGMTARAVPMEAALLQEMTRQLLALEGVAAVLYDLTHKPPGTIEWE